MNSLITLSSVDIAIIVGYIGAVIVLGVWLSRRHKNFDDYFLAGRVLTAPILVCTLVSTYYGIDVLLGDSELAYEEGIVGFFGYSMPIYLFYLMAALLLAKRLKNQGFTSLPEILMKYYGPKAQMLGAIASFLYSLPALSLFGFGLVAHVVLGWEPMVGAAILGGAALVYTILGGLWAVAITDAIQFFMMCITLAVAVPLALGKVGGYEWLEANLDPGYFQFFGDLPIWLVLIYVMTGLSVLVEPAFYQRIFSAKSAKSVRNAMLFGIILWGSYDWAVTAIAMAAKGAALQGILPMDVHPNEALLRIAVLSLPTGLVGLFIVGVLAAEMSTVDSYCLVAGSNLSYDIYKPRAKKNVTDEQLIKMTRIGVVISWVLGYIVAFYFDRMLALWVFLSTLLTSTVLVPILLGIFCSEWRKPLAGLMSAVTGLVSAILFYGIVEWFGTFSEENGTTILTIITESGIRYDIWQEYAMLFTLPLSLTGFFVGLFLDRGSEKL